MESIFHGKRADLSVQTIVVIALCLVVLIVLIFVFRDQIGEVAKRFRGITDDVTDEEGNMVNMNDLFDKDEENADNQEPEEKS